MARRGVEADGLTQRDRFWLRHLERQAAGAETSKAYATREQVSIYALYRWSEGGLWRLLPRPGVSLRLHIRVGENYQVRAIRAPGRDVLVVWLPHAAGTATGSEIAARLVADRGWAVASLLPPPDLPAPGAALVEWVSLLEQRVRAGREALHITEGDRPACVVVMGISVGGIAALRVAEADAEVDGWLRCSLGAVARGLRMPLMPTARRTSRTRERSRRGSTPSTRRGTRSAWEHAGFSWSVDSSTG